MLQQNEIADAMHGVNRIHVHLSIVLQRVSEGMTKIANGEGKIGCEQEALIDTARTLISELLSALANLEDATRVD